MKQRRQNGHSWPGRQAICPGARAARLDNRGIYKTEAGLLNF
jgi:hypothetical protein